MKSYRNLSRFDLEIEHLPSHALTRTVFIKLTGPRADDRARSASPQTKAAEEGGGQILETGDLRVVPRSVTVWAMPWRSKKMYNNTRIEWWARVFVGDGPDESTVERARRDTGHEPVYLDTIQLDRRVAERHVSLPLSYIHHM